SQTLTPKPQTSSVHLDIGFLTQTSQPAFLLGVRFFRDQFFLNLFAYFGERARDAAAFIFDFENVIVSAQLDDVANFSGSQVERDFLEWRRQGAAVDPAPIAAKVTGAVFGINLRHALEFGSVNQLAQDLLRHCLLSRRI